ncbi:hypothetical protein DFH08DRAFT_974604 [Mycena albidolilacea]|uniref:Uncharacterized protein n=1 Tax=Mycena albidolilacea TaxID=1033008 RepID=A0AAD6Z6E5_9AGAR|nr:hypothetical protein DFH08DRAFT_974604 [Mycena albidolilacea]
MPQLPNETETEYLDRLCAMSEDAVEEELNEVDVDVWSKERKRRKDEKKEAERRAKEVKEEAVWKAKEEEAARKAKEEEKKKKKKEKAERAAKGAKPASKASVSGSGGKVTGKAKATRKALDIDEDEDEEEEAPAEKKRSGTRANDAQGSRFLAPTRIHHMAVQRPARGVATPKSIASGKLWRPTENA